MRGRIDRPSTNGLGGDAAEVGALLSVRAFVSLGELTPDDVHVQVLHGKIDCNDMLTDVTVQDLELAESCDGGPFGATGPRPNVRLGNLPRSGGPRRVRERGWHRPGLRERPCREVSSAG
jgi:hypothetical protein